MIFSPFKYLRGLPLIAVMVIVCGSALAQSGSAGGSIGNDDKSMSGSREGPRSIEPDRSTRRTKPTEEQSRSTSHRNGATAGNGGSFDGEWASPGEAPNWQ